MLQPVYTNRFKKSIAQCAKRQYDLSLFKAIATMLIEEQTLPIKHAVHKLSGNFASHWECHIKSDWLLIFRYNEAHTQIIFEDTGTHSDLFK